MARALVFLAMLIVLVEATGRWHHNSHEERWSVVLMSGHELPYSEMKLGSWRIAGHAHKKLSSTHLILARPRSVVLPSNADPSNWKGVMSAKLLIGHGRYHRGVPEDAVAEPLWAKQWHLHNYTFTGRLIPTSQVHINVMEAWQSGATGEGVHVAVVDDGLQSRHPDLKDNFDYEGSYDFNEDKPTVEPTNYDAHGTEAAGAAAAGLNAACGAGVAPKARVSGIRLMAADTVTDEQEALSLSYEDQRNHIYSNSWGPYDDGERLEGPGVLLRAAMRQSITEGRSGLGVIYVWAAGNGRQYNDNCNFDGYANSRYTITVPAITHMGLGAYYSEDCSANVVSAPSSGSWDNPNSIVTTDLLGAYGASTTDCSSTFGGTSAAAPLVAGIVALMLSARPSLGWRDVQGVLIHAADEVDTSSASWQVNGAGLRYSHTYGFGCANAARAVALARTWPLYPAYIELDAPNVTFAVGASNSTVAITQAFRLEAVAVTFTASVVSRGRLTVKLVSPSGTVSYLQPTHPDRQSNIAQWTYGSVAHWDENSSGAWTLLLQANDTNGKWKSASWVLHLYGHNEERPAPPDVVTCSNECNTGQVRNTDDCGCHCEPIDCPEPMIQQDPETCACVCPPSRCALGYKSDPANCGCKPDDESA